MEKVIKKYKPDKYRLNTWLEPELISKLKAYAGFQNITLSEAVERLLKDELSKTVLIRQINNKPIIQFDSQRLNSLADRGLKEYNKGKTKIIKTKKDLQNFCDEIEKAAK